MMLRRLRDRLRLFGRNTRMDLPLHSLPDERHEKTLRDADRQLAQLNRELAIIAANIAHRDGSADDVARG